MQKFGIFIILFFTLCSLGFQTPVSAADSVPSSIALADDGQPIGLDDMYFSAKLNRVLVPAGRTGKLILIDPSNRSMTSIAGFGTQPPANGGRGIGITSVDEQDGLLLVTDRSLHQLDVVDPRAGKIISSAPLAAAPDYVRYVASTDEIWVTEPRDEKIEIFTNPKPGSAPVHSAAIEVVGGPEDLAIDAKRGVAYTNIDGGKTDVIDLKSRKIVQTWPNGCEGAEGALLDDTGRFLFVACHEGKVVSMDAENGGKILSTVSSGSGIDIIAYNAKLKHLYLPGAKSATLGIVAVSPKGELTLVKTEPSVQRGHCVTADPNGNAYVCDPEHGKLLVIHDQK